MKLADILLTNAKSKAMALLMAIGVWVFAYNFSRKTMTAAVPLRIQSPPNWSVSGEAPSAVKVSINYPMFIEDRLREALRSPGELYCQLDADLTEGGPDEQDLDLTISAENFRLPRDTATDARIWPEEPLRLRLRFAREETRSDVAVEVALSKPPAGYVIDTVWPWPRRVSITGPKREVAALKTVRTRMVKIDDMPVPRNMKIEGRVHVDPGKDALRCDDVIEYTIYLRRNPVTRTFEKVPIQLLMPPDYRYEVKLAGSVQDLTIKVTGAQNVVKGIKPENILLFVDVNRLTLGKQYQTVQWRIVGIEPGEEITVEGVKQDVSIEVLARSKGG